MKYEVKKTKMSLLMAVFICTSIFHGCSQYNNTTAILGDSVKSTDTTIKLTDKNKLDCLCNISGIGNITFAIYDHMSEEDCNNIVEKIRADLSEFLKVRDDEEKLAAFVEQLKLSDEINKSVISSANNAFTEIYGVGYDSDKCTEDQRRQYDLELKQCKMVEALKCYSRSIKLIEMSEKGIDSRVIVYSAVTTIKDEVVNACYLHLRGEDNNEGFMKSENAAKEDINNNTINSTDNIFYDKIYSRLVETNVSPFKEQPLIDRLRDAFDSCAWDIFY